MNGARAVAAGLILRPHKDSQVRRDPFVSKYPVAYLHARQPDPSVDGHAVRDSKWALAAAAVVGPVANYAMHLILIARRIFRSR